MSGAADSYIGKKIAFKTLADVVLKDNSKEIADSGKWPLVIDLKGMVATFFQYQNVNFINCLSPMDLLPDKLRLAILGAIRYGKPVVLDLGDMDSLEGVRAKVDAIQEGLLDSILDKSIIEKELFLQLVRPEDGPDYEHNMFGLVNEFQLIIITKNPSPEKAALDVTFPVTVLPD